VRQFPNGLELASEVLNGLRSELLERAAALDIPIEGASWCAVLAGELGLHMPVAAAEQPGPPSQQNTSAGRHGQFDEDPHWEAFVHEVWLICQRSSVDDPRRVSHFARTR
jgi:hypothetical protein